MDFEEQLEKAEKLPYPSLVGASVKSADDSVHNNYIHPEKYTGKSKSKPGKKSLLNSSIGASLDDLISEGALLGSDEDFDRFLDDKGNVLSDAKYSEKQSKDESSAEKQDPHKPVKRSSLYQAESADVGEDDAAVLSPVDSTAGELPQESRPLSELDNYSTPNLSEYQIGHQITDHSDLLDSVKSYDLSKLPTAEDNEFRSKRNDAYSSRTPNSSVRPSSIRSNSGFAADKLDFGQNVQVSETDSLHAPYFQSDDRATSRSISRVAFRDRSVDRSRSRSRSTSVATPHLARGDNYKNTHEEAPSKYELPAEMRVDEDEEPEDRRSRQAKPTLGDSIAAAEANRSGVSDTESVTRDPSLVTSGDYTNFNADGHETVLREHNLYSLRSQSSTNYLRSISRSRSRKPAHDKGTASGLNEKNDSNTSELEREGALVSDDPYSQVDDLDGMMKKVLKESAAKSAFAQNTAVKSKDKAVKEDLVGSTVETPRVETARLGDISEAETASEVKEDSADVPDEEKTESITASETEAKVKDVPINDVPAEDKDIETHEQLLAESAPTVSASDIHVEDAKEAKKSESIIYSDKLEESEQEASQESEPHGVNDVSAEEKDKETREQLITEEAPVLSASDIHVSKPTLEKDPASDETAEIPDVETKEATIEPIEPKEKSIEKEAEVSELEGSQLKASASGTPAKKELDAPVPSAEVTSGEENFQSARETKVDSAEPVAASESGKSIEAAKDPSNLVTEVDDIPTSSVKAVSSKEKKSVAVEDDDDFEVSAEELRKHLESLPIYLYTSLAGGMQIITRTNRLATILQANGVKFEHKDLGTDEEAKKIWRRYAAGKTLPGVVRGDDFIGNWEFIEEVNEDYRLKEVLYETL